jgi:hypothetical protein
MGKAFVRRIAYTGSIGHLHPLYSVVAAIWSWTGRFAGDPVDGLADRFMRMWGFFRQEPSSEDPIFTDRTGYPGAFEEIRDRAHLDIRRNIH